MMITIIKAIHVVTALLSIMGFLIRGWWKISHHPLADWRCMKIIPHINDSALLVSAITLAFLTGQTPWQHTWLLAKIVALLVYIFLGIVVMRLAKTTLSRTLAFLAAILCFCYIVLVAINKSTLPWV